MIPNQIAFLLLLLRWLGCGACLKRTRSDVDVGEGGAVEVGGRGEDLVVVVTDKPTD